MVIPDAVSKSVVGSQTTTMEFQNKVEDDTELNHDGNKNKNTFGIEDFGYLSEQDTKKPKSRSKQDDGSHNDPSLLDSSEYDSVISSSGRNVWLGIAIKR